MREVCRKRQINNKDFEDYPLIKKYLNNEKPFEPTNEVEANSSQNEKEAKKPLIQCPDCGKDVSSRAKVCIHCGCPLETEETSKVVDNMSGYDSSSSIFSKKQNTDEVRCPKCGSTSLSANKKGFSVGKAAAGLLIPGGVLWGLHGKNKVEVTCLKCGKKFMAGKGG